MTHALREFASLRKHWALYLIFTGAIVLRLFYFMEYQGLPFFTNLRLDDLLYHETGVRISKGDWALGSEVYLMSPLYSYFVGFLYWVFGVNFFVIRIAQVGLGLISTVLISKVTNEFFGRRISIGITALSAFYLPLYFYEMQYSVAAIGFFLTSLSLYWISKLKCNQQNIKIWIFLSLTLGFQILARPNIGILIVPLLYFYIRYFADKKNIFQKTLVLLLFTLLPILPVFLRNGIVAHQWTPVTAAGGVNFYLGNGPEAIGTFTVPSFLPEAVNAEAQFKAFHSHAEMKSGQTLTQSETDRYWFRESFESIYKDPYKWIKLLFFKLRLFFNHREIENSQSFDFHRRISQILSLPLFDFSFLSALSLIGMISLLMSAIPIFRLIGAMAGASIVANILFFILSHYRFPSIPILFLCTGMAIQNISEKLKNRNFLKILSITIVLILLSFEFSRPLVPETFDDEYFKLGYSATVQEKFALADWAYKKALEINPNHLSAHKNLAVVYEAFGQRELALEHWKEVSRISTTGNQLQFDFAQKKILELTR